MTTRTASFQVMVDGRDVSSNFTPFLISLTVKLDDDGNADEATFELDDSYGQIGLPGMGASVSILLGWTDTGVAQVFDGTLDTAHSGGAARSEGSRGRGRTLTLLAKSADMTSKLKQRLDDHMDHASFADVAQAWGQKAGLSAVKVDDALASVHRPYWSIGDSFMGWGEAIARQLDATFKIYGDTAVFVSRSGGQSVSGRDLEDVNVTWGDNLIEWSIAPILSRPDFGTFGTRWYDPKAAHWKEETEDGSGSSKSQVKHQHKFKAATQDQAQQQSGSNQTEGEREKGGADSVVIDGNVLAQPSAKCNVVGIRPGVDGTYLISSVTHTLNRRSGFTTTLGLKQPAGGASVDSRVAGLTTA